MEVIQSLVKIKHKALIINSKADCIQANSRPQRATIEICNYTLLTSRLLHQELANYNWSNLIAAIDNNTDSIDNSYDDFVRIVVVGTCRFWDISMIMLGFGLLAGVCLVLEHKHEYCLVLVHEQEYAWFWFNMNKNIFRKHEFACSSSF